MSRTINQLILTGLLVMTLLAVPGMASDEAIDLSPLAEHAGEFSFLEGMDTTSPVTLQTRFRLGDKDGIGALQGLWIAGFSESPDAPPTALSLVWSEDTTGWFPVWGVHLQSDADLFPAGLSTKVGSGLLSGSSYVSSQVVSPQVDHLYQAELSYDPRTGQAAIGMSDLTEGTRLFSQALTLEPFRDKLYPAVGLVGEGHGVQIESFTASPHGVPLGTAWDLMVYESDRYSRLPVYRLTPGYDLALRLGADEQGFPGTLAFVVKDGTSVETLFEQEAHARNEDLLLPFAADELPFGEVSLHLNYVDESGREWPLGTRSLLLVAANIDVNFGPLEVGCDALHGTVTLTSQDETVHDLPIRLLAAIGEPDQRDAAMELVLETTLERLSTETTVIPFTIPMYSEEQLFSVVFDVDFGVPVGKVMQKNRFHALVVR